MKLPPKFYFGIARIALGYVINSAKDARDFGGSPAEQIPEDIKKAPESKNRGVSTEDTIEYQRRELIKEMALLEKHLQQGCKIGNVACDCCSKHPMTIEGLALETAGMSSDPVYGKIASWCQEVEPMLTADASASGNYDEQYPQLASELRMLRKELMGTIVEGG